MSMALSGAWETVAPGRSVVWRTFLRGLAVELEVHAGSEATAAILRSVGRQMARHLVLVSVDSLEALELEMNTVLAEIGWGSVHLTLQEADRCVALIHKGMPRIGSSGAPAGTWLAPVLEGLYHGWMGQQPGADKSFVASIGRHEGDTVFIRYGRSLGSD
jgi:hypothetical protein